MGCTAGYNQQVLGVCTARILNKLNVPFIVLGEEEWCCGSVAKARMNDDKATGAKALISTCPFCRRNLLDGRDELKMDMYVDDLVVLVAYLMGLSTEIKPPAPGSPKETISDLFRTQTIPPKPPEPSKEAPKEATTK